MAPIAPMIIKYINQNIEYLLAESVCIVDFKTTLSILLSKKILHNTSKNHITSLK